MESKKTFQTDPGLKLMDRVSRALTYYQYAYRTEQSYMRWIKSYIRYLGRRNVPENRYHREIDNYLEYLAAEKKLSPSSCRQALNAIGFLYRRVFEVPVDVDAAPVKIRKTPSIPLIVSPDEVRRIFEFMKGRHLLMAQLLYGSGLRLMECVRLRICQLNFKRNLITIYPVKARTPRDVMIPEKIRKPLIEHLDRIKKQHHDDLTVGAGKVPVPKPFAAKYPGTAHKFLWQYLFPAAKIATDPRSGLKGRSHVLESGLQKAVQTAVRRAGIEKRISCSTFRHSFAVHLLQRNVDIKTVQGLMGHDDVRKTQEYLEFLDKRDITQLSPLDNL